MALSRKMKRGKMSRRVRRGKGSRSGRKQRGGGLFTINLKYSQPMVLAGRPTPALTAQKAAADKVAGNVALVGPLPDGFTGGTAVEKQVFSFALPAGKTLTSLSVMKTGGTPVTIPVTVGAAAGTGAKAEVTGQNVKVSNLNASTLGLLGADPGTLVLSGVVSD